MRVHAAGRTDTGMVREHNEDAILLNDALGLFVVADGMGGRLAGEVASRMAVEILGGHMERAAKGEEPLVGGVDDRYSAAANRLASGIRLANRAIHEAGMSSDAWRGMGSTIVVAQVHGERLAIAHVGDSRAYLVRSGSIMQLTDDHSLVAEQQRQGLITKEDAEGSSMRNIITRALGPDVDVEVDLNELDLMDGDRLVLCSDGLTTMVSDAEILAAVAAESDPDAACAFLVDVAKRNGGTDNISLILLHLNAEGFFAGLRKIFSNGR